MVRRAGVVGAVLALFVSASVSAAALVPAGGAAAGPSFVRISGTVSDGLGRPLEGARVSTPSRAVYTAADGSYLLDMGTSTGRFAVTAIRQDTLSQTQDVDALTPGEYTADFTLLYRIVGQIEPPAVSTATGDASVLLTVATFAPLPGSPGQTGGASCVYVSDSRTGQTAAALYGSTAGDGASYWTHAVQLPQGTPEGAHQLSFLARDCATGTALTYDSVALTYVVDNTVPTLSDPAPIGWTATSSPQVSVAVADSGGAGFDPSTASIKVDGIPLATTYAAGRISAAASGLAPGEHSAVASLQDKAGNSSGLSFAFSLDLIQPNLSDPSPEGPISSRTPLISVRATDSESGINPARVRMTLTYAGLITSTLSPTFDPSTGLIVYQVPALPQSVGVGRMLLLDGSYTVFVEVRDAAGNVSSIQWAFTVATVGA